MIDPNFFSNRKKKITSFLSAYRNFIDVSTKEGPTLLSNATDKFDCPLKDDERISLCSGGHDCQKLKDALLRCSHWFGYHHLLNKVVTNCVVAPAIQAVQANPNANSPVQAVAGVPQSIIYLNPIKVLEVYLDKLLDIAQKNASLIWGNQSFTDQNQKVFFELMAANGNLTNAGCLNNAGKKVIQQHFFSKILAHQTLAMLTNEARQLIERQSDLFTWKDPTGTEDKEMDGLSIIALIF